MSREINEINKSNSKTDKYSLKIIFLCKKINKMNPITIMIEL